MSDEKGRDILIFLMIGLKMASQIRQHSLMVMNSSQMKPIGQYVYGKVSLFIMENTYLVSMCCSLAY